LNIRAAASTELARALRRSGDVVGANVAFDQALGLYDRKGNIAAASRLRDRWG
jgi:hypothetical protein